MSRKTVYRTLVTLLMIALLAGLLMWQEHRYRLISACTAHGGVWDGGRCRLVPPVYLERGIKRSGGGTARLARVTIRRLETRPFRTARSNRARDR